MRDVKLISNSLSRSIDYEKKGNRNQFKQEWNHLDMKFRIILKEMFRQKYLIEKALIPLPLFKNRFYVPLTLKSFHISTRE